ncbi:hypothetical protein AB205_0100430, partial [Aquarana catesbeiana]
VPRVCVSWGTRTQIHSNTTSRVPRHTAHKEHRSPKCQGPRSIGKRLAFSPLQKSLSRLGPSHFSPFGRRLTQEETPDGTPNKLFQTKHYSPSQPLPLSENISATEERPGLALLPGVLSASGEKTGCLGSLRHAVGDLGRLPSIPGVYRWRL